jgi:GH15 family glucan-1,4-alpha-glucosidase
MPIGGYAAIGDERTVALVADDGSIDWLALPDLDSDPVFARLLGRDAGRFSLEPEIPYRSERRYLGDTNVLETTFTTAEGTVRVTDAMTLGADGRPAARELVRRVEGLAGRVPLSWSVEPRFGFGTRRGDVATSDSAFAIDLGGETLSVYAWEAEAVCQRGAVRGRFMAERGRQALLAIRAADGERRAAPDRDELESRLDATASRWRAWSGGLDYEGPWRNAVIRSALALKLLVYEPTGAIAAAATTSLPETLGGERNWDYRFSWVRDSSLALDALLSLGSTSEAGAYFAWLTHATARTHPRLRVLYPLNGNAPARERVVPLEGYRGSQPVRAGNAAVRQLQLDLYGALLQTAWLYTASGGRIDGVTRLRLAEVADLVCAQWRRPDAGMWEVRSAPRHFTHSKMLCWVALDRARRLALRGVIPGEGLGRWEREAAAIARFVEDRCWSMAKRAYVRSAGSDELDSGLLLAEVHGFAPSGRARSSQTIDAVRRELGHGPLLYRYLGEDGLRGREGCFLACSFWLVDALARCGRADEAAETFEQLIALANDVGLYAEEVDPDSGEFLGNFPQALVHLSLINAAGSLRRFG